MNESLIIGKRAFFSALSILLLLMVAAGLMGRILPSGAYERTLSAEGIETVVPGSYREDSLEVQLPPWRWFTAPVELLFGPEGGMVIAIILFMLLIAGSISLLASSGILAQLITAAAFRWREERNLFMAVTVLVFMLFGSFLGTMEEALVLVPLAVSLALGLGWDRFTGAAITLGAMALGFSAAITNPFTIGVAQKLAGLPPFSGAPLRAFVFILTYLIFMLFLIRYTRSLAPIALYGGRSGVPDAPERAADPAPAAQTGSGEGNENGDGKGREGKGLDGKVRRAFIWLFSWLGAMVLALFGAFLLGASSLLFPLMVLFFMCASIGSALLSGFSPGASVAAFFKGLGGIAPGIILVLMAGSVKTTLHNSGVLDTILFRAAGAVESAGPVSGTLLIYLLVLFLNFFISSGSAKAFLVMPLITPLADLTGIGRQTAVLAFMFGDGYSNLLYPTNALLLICLAITGISWGQWFRKIIPLQLILMLMSVGVLVFAALVGY